MIFKKALKWGFVFLALTLLVVIYKFFNPVENGYFPKCPFRTLTGFKCPGCGSQRAIHHLLNFNLTGAVHENVLLVISIPYLVTGFIFDMIKNPGPSVVKWRKRLFGTKAIFIVLTVIILFWVCRNIQFCTDAALY